jgi:hypothetical protein
MTTLGRTLQESGGQKTYQRSAADEYRGLSPGKVLHLTHDGPEVLIAQTMGKSLQSLGCLIGILGQRPVLF